MKAKFFRILLALTLSLTALLNSGLLVNATSTLKDYQDTIPGGGYVFQTVQASDAGIRETAQLFTANSTYYANRVEIYGRKLGLARIFDIGIKAVVAGYPTGDFLAYQEINSDIFSTSWSWVGIDFVSAWPLMASGTQYALCLEPDLEGFLSDDYNHLEWRGTLQDLYAGGSIVFDLSPVTPWVTNLGGAPTNDLLFRIYGSGTAIAYTVSVDDNPYLRQAVDGNFTCGVFVTLSDNFTDYTNVNCVLSANVSLASPISMYKTIEGYTGEPDAHYTVFYFDTDNTLLTHPITGQLLANTRYYYRGSANVSGVMYYSDIKTFLTNYEAYPIPDKPLISITKIEDVSDYYNEPYVFEVTAKISTTNTTDLVSGHGMQFSLNIASSGTLSPTVYSYNIPELSADGSYLAVLNLSNLAVYSGQKLYFRAYMDTPYYERLYSTIVSFDVTTGEAGNTPPTIGMFNDIFKNIKAQLGLTGVMGSWAFLGLLLLIIALIFGIVMFTAKDRTAKTCIAIIWMLISIAILGAFIFSGELGIWPILILVIAVVMFVTTIIGLKLSGGTA